MQNNSHLFPPAPPPKFPNSIPKYTIYACWGKTNRKICSLQKKQDAESCLSCKNDSRILSRYKPLPSLSHIIHLNHKNLISHGLGI